MPAGFCPTMSYGSRKRGYDQIVYGGGGFDLPSSTAYNVEPVTNTSSSSCANNGRQTPRCARRSPPFVAALFFTLRRTVDNTVDLYAAKPDIRSESRFLPTPPAFDATVRGFPSEYRSASWHGKTRMVWLYPMVKKFWRYVYSFRQNSRTWQTQRHTDTQTPHADIAALMHRIARQKRKTFITSMTSAAAIYVSKMLVSSVGYKHIGANRLRLTSHA